MPAREDTINTALGEVLQELRPTSWRVLAEEQRTLRGSAKRPDVLIEEPAGWPVVIEAERENHTSAETDALARLGAIVESSGREIESAIALVYPLDVREQTGGKAIRAALRETDGLEYALYMATSGDVVERLPTSGWLQGNVRDLAMLAHRASTPAPRIERLVDTLEHGVNSAEGAFNRRHREHTGNHLGPEIAEILGQSDDQGGQTRRMAMTVLINALIFHESLAQAEFKLDDGQRRVAPVRDFVSDASGFDQQRIIEEWRAILKVNYWPIFATAAAILDRMPIATADAVLYSLWDAAQQLIRGGVTKSHDLTGVIFQRLIADRKFLATFYTRPASAALLAGLAIPADRELGGAEWGDAETIASLQIGDFACGTGTLLAAAYQRISLLHELHGGDPKALHPKMMKSGLHGLDVLNVAVHLTAAMLAGGHPDVPFGGECLLTMPYGRWGEGKRDVAVGSLDLLAEHVQAGLIEHASAVTAGGRKPEDVRDLINRVAHGTFDLVIMNPPFTRPGGHEGKKKGTGNPAFAAFNVPKATQKRMTEALKHLRGGAPLAKGNAGLPAEFVDLALRKLNARGSLALVLPLSAVSGIDWEPVRQRLVSEFNEIIVITIAQPRNPHRSFSADTDIAECLVVARKDAESPARAYFAVLAERPASISEGHLIALQIQRQIKRGATRRLDSTTMGTTPLQLGEDYAGYLFECELPEDGPWPVVGIADGTLAQVAHHLAHGQLHGLTSPSSAPIRIPVTPIHDIGGAGPYHMAINWNLADGTPQGPFDVLKPPESAIPTYPILWAHDAKAERQMVVEPDAEGRIKDWPSDQDLINRKAEEIAETATRAHYNRDFQFNAQSLIVAMTERKCIGGRAWPSVILGDPQAEWAFALWSNSTLGLLMHWWVSNKSQAGRGSTTITTIPQVPTLDVRQLTTRQKKIAEESFAALRGERFLPFDQIDEDPARAELDRRLIVDVLGLPAQLCAPDGPIDLLRRKLAQEPQIHGGKKSRVVFTDKGEKTERRHDRD